jgi:hypothetical protein
VPVVTVAEEVFDDLVDEPGLAIAADGAISTRIAGSRQ